MLRTIFKIPKKSCFHTKTTKMEILTTEHNRNQMTTAVRDVFIHRGKFRVKEQHPTFACDCHRPKKEKKSEWNRDQGVLAKWVGGHGSRRNWGGVGGSECVSIFADVEKWRQKVIFKNEWNFFFCRTMKQSCFVCIASSKWNGKDVCLGLLVVVVVKVECFTYAQRSIMSREWDLSSRWAIGRSVVTNGRDELNWIGNWLHYLWHFHF